MDRQTQTEFLLSVFRGNEDAVAFIEDLGEISQVWDDLIDGDTQVSKEAVNTAFWRALVEVPGNKFYRDNFAVLFPILQSVIFDWLTASRLEWYTAEHERTLAFVLRDSLVSVVVMCAGIVGGRDWAVEQGPAIRQYFHDETLPEYLSNLQKRGPS